MKRIILLVVGVICSSCYTITFGDNGLYSRETCAEIRQQHRTVGAFTKGAGVASSAVLVLQSEMNSTDVKHTRNAKEVNAAAIGLAIGTTVGLYLLDDMNDEMQGYCENRPRAGDTK